jgi:hypothetical protein
VDVIESGSRWWHVVAESSDADTQNANLAHIKAVEDALANRNLRQFAASAAEHQFFLTNNVTSLSSLSFHVSPTEGYHNGNALIGLLSSGCWSIPKTDAHFRCHSWT